MDEKIENFKILLKNITQRPGMFVGNEDYYRIVAYINGYLHAVEISNLDFKSFSKFINTKYNFPTNLVWEYAIKETSKTNKESIQKIHNDFIEYIDLIKKTSSQLRNDAFFIDNEFLFIQNLLAYPPINH